MGWLSNWFAPSSNSGSSGSNRSQSSDDESSSGCKSYQTSGGPKITQCTDGTKSFTHTSETKKGAKEVTYTYEQKK